MLLARCILSEFGTMYAQLQVLQVAVDALPIATVTGPSPTKSALKKMNLDLAAENDALSALLNADLQSTIDGKGMYIVPCIIHWYPLIGFFPRTFLGFFCICCLIFCDFHDPPARSQRAKEAHV
jgi:hypothetical protein